MLVVDKLIVLLVSLAKYPVIRCLVLPELLCDVLLPLHETHEAKEDGIEGRTHDELVQHDLLDDGGGGLAHVPGVQPSVPVEQDHGQHQSAQDPISAG